MMCNQFLSGDTDQVLRHKVTPVFMCFHFSYEINTSAKIGVAETRYS